MKFYFWRKFLAIMSAVSTIISIKAINDCLKSGKKKSNFKCKKALTEEKFFHCKLYIFFPESQTWKHWGFFVTCYQILFGDPKEKGAMTMLNQNCVSHLVFQRPASRPVPRLVL